MNQPQFSEAVPLSLYIHLPWCIRKCPYCDFNSHEAAAGTLPEVQYVEALLADLEQSVPLVWGRRISTIFIGGGTPSLFSATAIDQFLSTARGLLNIAPNAEITMEANPGTVEAEKFSAFREIGINRLSIGVQSLENEQLAGLGRIHDRNEAITAVQIARAAGFDNINLDMMFALPEQTSSAAEDDLRALIALDPEHISYYQLTLEPNTYFHKFPPKLPEHDKRSDIAERGHQLLATNGYQQYEVSAFAKPGSQCQHNINYWEFGDYLGIGAGAHGKITDQAAGTIRRTVKPRQPKQYMHNMAKQIESSSRDIPVADIPFEFFLNALRLNNGVSKDLFTLRTGLGLTHIDPIVTQLRTEGFLSENENGIQASEFGRNFIDDIAQKFLP